MITGFRWHLGGAQAYYGVTPDLACFGKAMANGMPLSAVVGRKDIMKLMAPPDNIFYSGTMFGESLSLAASIATIKKMERENVINHLWKVGSHIMTELYPIMEKYEDKYFLGQYISFSGMHPRMKVNFHDGPRATANQIRTVFVQEMAKNGVLIINSHNVSYSIRESEIKRIISAYDKTLETIASKTYFGNIQELITEETYKFDPLRKS